MYLWNNTEKTLKELYWCPTKGISLPKEVWTLHFLLTHGEKVQVLISLELSWQWYLMKLQLRPAQVSVMEKQEELLCGRYLLRETSSCSGCWVVGWRTHLPLSISTRTSSSKSMLRSVAAALKLRPAGVLGQRSLNSWLTAEKPDGFLCGSWLLGRRRRRRKRRKVIGLRWSRWLRLEKEKYDVEEKMGEE